MIDLIVFLILVSLGYLMGSYFEKKHFQSLKIREKKTVHLPVINCGKKAIFPEVSEANLFMGSVVISADYYKIVAFAIQNLIGGQIVVFESLLERGRREAILRMKESAIAWGATQIVNVRLETSNIGRQAGKQGLVAIEVLVYGTGVK